MHSDGINDAQTESQSQTTMAHEFVQLAQSFLRTLKVPAQDIEKNAKALFAETVSKMDLVTRDELARQTVLLQAAQSELAEMQQKITALEEKIAQ